MAKSSKPKTISDSVPAEPALPVNLANRTEICHALNDAIPALLPQFPQSHTHTDVQIALGLTAAVSLLAACAYIWYFMIPFEQTSWMVYVVGAYVVLQSALWGWNTYVVRDCVFMSETPEGSLKISTHLTPGVTTGLWPRAVHGGEPRYHFHVVKNGHKKSGHKRIGELFDNTGKLNEAGFKTWIDTLVI